MRARLELRLTQKLMMTPQLQQAIKLLQLGRLELQQALTQETLENPLLEELVSEEEEEGTSSEEGRTEEVPSPAGEEEERPKEAASADEFKWESFLEDDSEWEGFSRGGAGGDPEERPSYDQTLTRPVTLTDHLLWQLAVWVLSEKEKEIGRALIGNIDDDGYLREPLEEISSTSGASVAEVDRVLKVVQQFDPVGVAARGLEECLLLQLEPLGLSGSLVETIIKNHLEDLEKKRYPAIARTCEVGLEEVTAAAHVIERLEPKPGRPYAQTDNVCIIPDVFVTRSEGSWVVTLNDDGMPKLKISPYYRSILRSTEGGKDETRAYLKERFQSALWFVRSIEQRNRTILLVSQSIVRFQEAFLERGVSHLRPLVLKQVADDVGVHESTVSRVTTNKYMHTPQGTLELKYFFNSGIARFSDREESLSSIAVREMIRKMVDEERPDAPLKDQEIVERLKAQNVKIARRTVTKYRAWLKIPPASRRKRY